MIALCLLLSGCGAGEAQRRDLREAYQKMQRCEMTAAVTCQTGALEWTGTLKCTYVPGGESTVEVLEPLALAGVRATLRDEGWTLEYGDLCLDIGPVSEAGIAPATALARMMAAAREGWLLEENREERDGTPCVRLALEQTLEETEAGSIVTTLWLKEADGAPLWGEIALEGERIFSAAFTDFAFCDSTESDADG